MMRSVLNTDPILSVPNSSGVPNVKTVPNVPTMTMNDPSVTNSKKLLGVPTGVYQTSSVGYHSATNVPTFTRNDA